MVVSNNAGCRDCIPVLMQVHRTLASMTRRAMLSKLICHRSAQRLYKASVQGALEAAGVQHELHVTQRPRHATDILAGLDLQGVDAVVFMGGDGTVHEGLQVGEMLEAQVLVR